MIHEVTGLPFEAPEVPDGPKQQRKIIVEQHCKWPIDFTSSGIRIEGLKNETTWRIAKLMVVKLFCLQHYTHFLTHLMAAIIGVTQGNMYNWCTFIQNRLPIPQGLSEKPKLLAWTEVEDAEERRRKKGKYKVEENTPRRSPEHPLHPSTKQGATIGAYQVVKKLLNLEHGNTCNSKCRRAKHSCCVVWHVIPMREDQLKSLRAVVEFFPLLCCPAFGVSYDLGDLIEAIDTHLSSLCRILEAVVGFAGARKGIGAGTVATKDHLLSTKINHSLHDNLCHQSVLNVLRVSFVNLKIVKAWIAWENLPLCIIKRAKGLDFAYCPNRSKESNDDACLPKSKFQRQTRKMKAEFPLLGIAQLCVWWIESYAVSYRCVVVNVSSLQTTKLSYGICYQLLTVD
eukprot:Gb_09247 [translate_table: standard]